MRDPLDQFSFTVDHDADPVDLDSAVADFLISLFEQPTTGDTPTASGDGQGDYTSSRIMKGST